jgi:NitT/TauT family transport system permease protein
MNTHPKFWGIHAQPGQKFAWLLAALPFVLIVAVYLVASDIRLEANPQDKLLPSLVQMKDAMMRMAFSEDRRSGDYLLWVDTLSSLQRLAIGVLSAALAGLLMGLNIGLFRGFKGLMNPVVTFVSMIPPLAILPILFITFGVGELGKVMLIFIGIFPVITRDIALATAKIPRQQITKALTLGATGTAVTYRIILPQIMPRLIDTLRLSLGAAWLFLIAAEAIASTDGLGYRIFLVRRYLAMDVIIPYVMWVTLIGFLIDYLLRLLISWRYRWYSS